MEISAQKTKKNSQTSFKRDPLWYKDAIIYEVHIRSFFDSNNDGIGDFRGLIEKLDYIADLGITAIWLLPFYPSPLKDDGYDIADYFNINPDYGTLRDFKDLMREAHKRGIKVITELVINHTSDQHEWFKLSRDTRPDNKYKDFYVWSDHPNKYEDARIIFKDFETSNWSWDPISKRYYWHRFYSHQPDLNFDNPEVTNAIFKVLDFWMDLGVDGMRLDAIPYLFERENTDCENLPETHVFLKGLRKRIEKKYPNRVLLAEANQWPEDAVSYFGKGDECHMCFHFPLMPRLFMALKMEDRFSIIDILKQTPDIPENCQWATFLRNHDELTLEMVTDEERDYMYRVYATNSRSIINLGIRQRLAPLLENDRRQIELLVALLFSLPGTPVIYYGDEIGMGDNIYLGDRDGVRTPFQWSPDRNAGFSKADPQSLYLPAVINPEYHYEAINVEVQQNNPSSLLWWMKNLISLRKQYSAFGRGKIKFLNPENPKVLTFIRSNEGKSVLVIGNLSRKVQFIELNLAEYQRQVPIEMFSRVDFPPIGELPYFLTVGPYGFYWFELSQKENQETTQWMLRDTTPIDVPMEPMHALEDRNICSKIEKKLQTYLPKMRWFAGKSKSISYCEIIDIILIPHYKQKNQSALTIVKVKYLDGDPDFYLVTIGYSQGERAKRILEEMPDIVFATVKRSNNEEPGVYHNATINPAFTQGILDLILKRKNRSGKLGNLTGETLANIKKEWLRTLPQPEFTGFEQSNSSLVFGKEFYLKIFRKIEAGENPDDEIPRHLIKNSVFHNYPELLGTLKYKNKNKNYTLGIVQKYIKNETNAWDLMLSHLSKYAEEALAKNQQKCSIEAPKNKYFNLLNDQAPEEFTKLAGNSIDLAKLLGKRTGEMHLALSTSFQNNAFTPEPIVPFFQRSLYQSFRNLADQTLILLEKKQSTLSKECQELVKLLFNSKEKIHSIFDGIKNGAINAKRIRVHGDYHLGQVLFNGKDFFILDFEGEPARSIGERRLKRLPIRDLAGMIRSFEYVVHYFLKEKLVRLEDKQILEPWLKTWSRWISVEFLKGYLEIVGQCNFFPKDITEAQKLLEIFVLEKAIYELGYELGSRPDWVQIPLEGILELCLNGEYANIKSKIFNGDSDNVIPPPK